MDRDNTFYMVKDLFDSFKDNIKERTTNPFLGTFLIVWLIKNWVLVYSLFYFDSKLTLDKRISYIQDYFNAQPFWLNLLIVVSITVLILILTYILLALSRLMANFNETTIIPWIYKVTDKSSIVRKVDYLLLRDKIRELEQRVEAEREAKLQAFRERDQLELQMVSNANNIPATNELLTTDVKFFNKIVGEYDKELIGQVVVNIRKGIYLGTMPLLNDLLKYNFVEVMSSHAGTNKYKLSKTGEEFVAWFNDHTATES